MNLQWCLYPWLLNHCQTCVCGERGRAPLFVVLLWVHYFYLWQHRACNLPMFQTLWQQLFQKKNHLPTTNLNGQWPCLLSWNMGKVPHIEGECPEESPVAGQRTLCGFHAHWVSLLSCFPVVMTSCDHASRVMNSILWLRFSNLVCIHLLFEFICY